MGSSCWGHRRRVGAVPSSCQGWEFGWLLRPLLAPGPPEGTAEPEMQGDARRWSRRALPHGAWGLARLGRCRTRPPAGVASASHGAWGLAHLGRCRMRPPAGVASAAHGAWGVAAGTRNRCRRRAVGSQGCLTDVSFHDAWDCVIRRETSAAEAGGGPFPVPVRMAARCCGRSSGGTAQAASHRRLVSRRRRRWFVG